MGPSFFTDLAATCGIAIIALVAAMIWAKIARPIMPLDETRAQFLLQEQFPGKVIEAIWVDASGKGAVAKSGAAALVLCQHGEAYVGRQIPWAIALADGFRTGEICISLADIHAPTAVISLPAWAPHEKAA